MIKKNAWTDQNRAKTTINGQQQQKDLQNQHKNKQLKQVLLWSEEVGIFFSFSSLDDCSAQAGRILPACAWQGINQTSDFSNGGRTNLIIDLYFPKQVVKDIFEI